jgi:hypothetical protein
MRGVLPTWASRLLGRISAGAVWGRYEIVDNIFANVPDYFDELTTKKRPQPQKVRTQRHRCIARVAAAVSDFVKTSGFWNDS